MLKECGYNKGLARVLATDLKTGIIGDKPDIERRQKIFAKHTIALPKISKFSTILFRQFETGNQCTGIHYPFALMSVFYQVNQKSTNNHTG